jgi:hypothetical protein
LSHHSVYIILIIYDLHLYSYVRTVLITTTYLSFHHFYSRCIGSPWYLEEKFEFRLHFKDTFFLRLKKNCSQCPHCTRVHAVGSIASEVLMLLDIIPACSHSHTHTHLSYIHVFNAHSVCTCIPTNGHVTRVFHRRPRWLLKNNILIAHHDIFITPTSVHV